MKKIMYFSILVILVSFVLADANETENKVKEPMKPALLVIDIQNQFLPYMEEREKNLGLEMINGAIWMFRQYGFPVILVYHTDPQWGPKPDTEVFQFPESVTINDNDPKVIKNFPNAFKKTELKKIVDERGCNTLFLCGLSAVGCVLATYFDAQDLDYNVFMIKDAIMSHESNLTDAVENICDTVSYTTLKVMLEGAEK